MYRDLFRFGKMANSRKGGEKMSEAETEQRKVLVEQAVRNLVTEIGHGNTTLTSEQGGVLKIENTEGQGILGLGYDASSGEVWLCPTQNHEAFQRNGGWNANDRMPLNSDKLDPRIGEDLQIEITESSDGNTEYRFLEGHWLTKFYRSMQEAGVKLDGSLHVAQKPDWSDHKAVALKPDQDALVAGPFPGKGYVEMKLAIKGLGGKTWSDGNWVSGARQEMRISP